MNRGLKIGLGVVGGLALLAVGTVGGGYFWANSARDAALARPVALSHKVDFPVPWPLSDAEIEELRVQKRAELAAAAPISVPAVPTEPTLAAISAPIDPATGLPAGTPAPVEKDPLEGVDLGAIAQERAKARGEHLVLARLGCAECHGADFAGGMMIDAPPMGKIRGPNITDGGVTKGWTVADWDRIVRHGVMSDGTVSIMPAEDFAMLADKDLSDVITYVRSFPASDKPSPPSEYGPVLTVLIATGQIPFAAELIDHNAPRPKEPPVEGATVEFGAHLAQGCKGCHGGNLSGGPIKGGDPSWPEAANLTPTGLAGYTLEDFQKAVQKGERKAGGVMPPPMPFAAYAKMTDVEIQALWAFVQTLPPTEKGVRAP